MNEKPRSRPWLWIVIALLVIGVAIWWFVHKDAEDSKASPHHGGPPQSVSEGTVDQGDIRVFFEGLGTVTPITSVTVKTQINGILEKVAFHEGQLVHQGDFIMQIDPRPYQVALEQAEGTLLRDQALLKEALLDQARYHTLLKQDSIARQTVDTQDALVLQDQGNVRTDQGAIDSAKLNLIYCHITAPATGRIGLRQVDQGNYVQTGDTTGLVVITQLQPISVIFTLPEDDLPEIERQPGGQDGRPAALPVQAWDRGDTTQLASGTLETTDNEVDTTTGTIKLRAIFDNKNNMLFPNQFTNARLLVETHHNVLRIPSTSVQTGEPGTFAYLIKPDNTVTVKPLKLGPQDGDKIEVLSGLAAGDHIVTDGADRLREGARVVLPGQTPDAAGKGGANGKHRHDDSATPQTGATAP
jgi:multidrug efflux system membrane fusion protein